MQSYSVWVGLMNLDMYVWMYPSKSEPSQQEAEESERVLIQSARVLTSYGMLQRL